MFSKISPKHGWVVVIKINSPYFKKIQKQVGSSIVLSAVNRMSNKRPIVSNLITN